MEVIWKVLPYEELEIRQLYGILKLRQDVFIIEQDCLYPDIDDWDPKCLHLLGEASQGEILAYSRLIPEGLRYDDYSIGRVAVKKEMRGLGLGEQLMRKSINFLFDLGVGMIRISAQSYLRKFYLKLGFKKVSQEYLEDGIPHFEMLLTKECYKDR